MKRGDLVTVAMSGAYGKPRPAVIVQAQFDEDLGSVTFLPLTSAVLPSQIFRVTIEPNATNGLRVPSQVMADKCSTQPTSRVGPVIGRLSETEMTAVNRALAIFLGFV
jgi:mRNA interferase MazF